MSTYIEVILRVLVQNSLNLITFTPIPFKGMKIWGFKIIERNKYSLLSILFSHT